MELKYLKCKDLEEIFSVSRSTIHRWRKKGMPCVQLDGPLRFEKNEILKWLKIKNSLEIET